MKTRQVIGLSILSSLITLLAVFVVMNSSGIAVAQKPVPTPTPIQQVAPQDPNALTVNSARPAMNEAPELPNAVAATTDYQHVAGSAFIPLYDNDTTDEVVYGSRGCTYLTGTHLFLNYPLILPHGSTVTQVRLYFNDTSAGNGTLHLAQYDDGAAYVYLSTLTTSGTAGLGFTTVNVTLTLDYANYNYVMYWMPGVAESSMQLCGFRVTYTRPFVGANFLPTVLNDAGQ